jgi:hypothetical protein
MSYKMPESGAFPTDDFELAVAEVTAGKFASSDWIYPPVV